MPDPAPSPGTPSGHGRMRDERLRSVWRSDPHALGGPPLRPTTLSSPVLEHVLVQAGQISAPFGRPLYIDEKKLLDDFFAGSIDTSRIRIVETRIANAPTTLGNQIRIAPGDNFVSDYRKSVLVHEATHVWQYQNRGTRYITCSVYHNVSEDLGTGDRNSAYLTYTLDSRRSFSEYPAEEQAQIVQDYYSLTYSYAGPRAHVPAWVRQRQGDMAHYERLMREVRAARPRTQEQIYSDALMQPPRDDIFPAPTDPSQRFVPLMPFLQLEF